eukprot:scaffold129566_cov18-Tisochrysis_lutea.AAC.1
MHQKFPGAGLASCEQVRAPLLLHSCQRNTLKADSTTRQSCICPLGTLRLSNASYNCSHGLWLHHTCVSFKAQNHMPGCPVLLHWNALNCTKFIALKECHQQTHAAFFEQGAK